MAEAPSSLLTLRDDLAKFEINLIAEAVTGLDHGTLKPTPQHCMEDRQYFVMHNSLRSVAEQRLAQYQSTEQTAVEVRAMSHAL
jgi:hypothetical protein